MNRSLSHTLSILIAAGATAQAGTDKYRLIWNSSPESSITVGWCQTDGEGGEVLYRKKDAAEGTPMRKHGVDRETTHHGIESRFVRLTRLEPDTVYEFSIRDSNSESQTFSFKTAPADGGEFSFAAGGDSRNHRDARQRANRAVAKLRPLFVCFGGDMINRSNGPEWADWLDDWQLTTGEDGRMVPIVAARGNHEGAKDIHSFFDTPTPDDYYALSFGGDLLRVYTLNSTIVRAGSQAKWLKKDLVAHKGTTWKVAHYHHPFRPHQSGKKEQHAQYNAWAPLFYDHGLNMAIECDSHVVKRTWPLRPSTEPGSDEGFIRDDANGITFVGEGCWGAPLRRNDDDKEWTRASGSFNQINWICVSPDRMFVRTILVDGADDAESVDESDPFALPGGMEIWEPEGGAVVDVLPRRGERPPTTDSLARVKIVVTRKTLLSPYTVRIEVDGDPGEGASLRFTTDGREPDATSTLYNGPFELKPPAKVRAALFRGGTPLTKSVLQKVGQ